MDMFPGADEWRARIKRQLAESSISMAEIGRYIGRSRARVHQILRPGKRLKPEDEGRIRVAIQQIMLERYLRLGTALGKCRTTARDKRAEIAAARVALEEASEQRTTSWETLKEKLGK